MRGKLIVFEGVEGCGKTTQLQRVRAWLEEHAFPLSIILTQEPGGTELGNQLRSLLLAQGKTIHDAAELLLYAADRAQHVEEVLKPQLSSGNIILCDRYTDSTIAYQGYGRGISLSFIQELNYLATGGLESDLTLWLDVDVELGLTRVKGRGNADRMEQADLAFHRRVQHGYSELAKAHPQRIIQVDASLNEVAVQQQIQAILSKSLTQWYGEKGIFLLN